jgi:hypothetical protein
MEIVEGARSLLGLQPRATERDRIERETDLGAAEATLVKLGAERAALLDKLQRMGDDDVNARNPLGAREVMLRQTLVPAAQRRVSELRHEAEKQRAADEYAARLKADPLLREGDEASAAVDEAERGLVELLAVINGTAKDAQGNTLPPPAGERLFLLQEQLRELRPASIAAKQRHADALARLKARDDAERAAAGERIRGEYMKRAKDARKHAEALTRSLAEVRKLAQEGRGARLLLPVPGPVESMLRIWLDGLNRFEERSGDAA